MRSALAYWALAMLLVGTRCLAADEHADGHDGYTPPKAGDMRVTLALYNDLSAAVESCKVGWVKQEELLRPHREGEAWETLNDMTLGPQTGRRLIATVGHVFSIRCAVRSTLFTIVGGKFSYNISVLLESERALEGRSIVRVLGPSQCLPRNAGWNALGPTWMDAIRIAASREYGGPDKVALCLCGEQSYASAFGLEFENPELPQVILDHLHPKCQCPARQDGTLNFDLFFPCDPIRRPGELLTDAVNCASVDAERDTHRIAFIHSEVHTRLGAKQLLWNQIRRVYGIRKASLIMPAAFNLDVEEEYRMARESKKSGTQEPAVFVVKQPRVHAQKGLELSRADTLQFGKRLMATLFLENPWSKDGYKLNLRRYALLICWRGRTLGVLHQDAKNHWGRQVYRDPSNATELSEEIFGGAITTGYVPASHYRSLPIRYSHLRELFDFSLLEETVELRLALALHSLATDAHPICSFSNPYEPNIPAIPECLTNALRYQVYGCDFEPRSDLRVSRMHECNVGPDFSPHSPLDRDLKRNVAADFVGFMGLDKRKPPNLWSAEHQRLHRVSMFYDSEAFDKDAALEKLSRLETPISRKDEL